MAEIEGSPHIVQPLPKTFTQQQIQRFNLFFQAIAQI